MLAAQLFFVLILLILCGFAPGFYLVRRFAWTPREKLCASVGLSLILLYLAAWTIYILPIAQPPAYFAVSGACLVLALLARRDLAAFFRIASVRRVLGGFAFLLLWSWSLLAMIRVYCGARWGGDWLEHFQRSLFFLQRFPLNTTIYRNYTLPARPPLMNLLGAFFLGQTADRYEIFQFVFVFLNLLPWLACCLILPAVAGRHRRARKSPLLPLLAIFAMSPLVMESALYTWTKALSAFFVILALAFYLSALRKRDTPRMIAAFLALSAGLLTHYSAGPYVVILTLHYLFTAFRRRGANFRELGAIAGVCGLLLLTWFGWSLAAYGASTTFASNTSITFSQKYQGSTLEKITGNLIDTLVPQIVRNPASIHQFDQPNQAGALRDNAFILYQTNLIFGMGLLGGPLVLLLLFRLVRAKQPVTKKMRAPERSFWLLLIPCAVILGIAVVGERDVDGVAHLTLVPLEILGLTWLAANFHRRRWMALLIVAGSLVDFSLGVLLQARVENLENSPGRTVYTGLSVVRGALALGLPGPDSLSRWSWENWFRKHQDANARGWLVEIDQYRGEGPAFARSAAMAKPLLQQSISEDHALWRGWFSRHGGSATLIGDSFGDAWIPTAFLLALWILLLGMLWRRSLHDFS
jgi:hypothetical protein